MAVLETYFKYVPDAQEPKPCYLSLYEVRPYYGGPEEGGWWGQDIILMAYKHFETEEEANLVASKIQEEVEAMIKEAEDAESEYCTRTMEWLEARGLEADYFPEPDGPSTFFVVTEESPGNSTSYGNRHYE